MRQLQSSNVGIAPASLTAILEQLLEQRIVYPTEGEWPTAEKAMHSLESWNPAAGFFHTATKYVNFRSLLDDASGRPRSTAAESARAAARVAGRCRQNHRVALPPRGADGPFAQVLLERRTWRRFGQRRLTLQELSDLLCYTAGAHHFLQLADGSRASLRTSPSGGARHPIDLFVVPLRIRGLSAGLYRYDGERHDLQKLSAGIRPQRVERYLPNQPWYQEAGALVLFSATFARTKERYGYSRAYRAVLIEAGHLCQTFCLTATWLNLAPFCSLALDDDAIERDLGIDGISQSVLYVAGVGPRPGSDSDCSVPVGVQPPLRSANPAFGDQPDPPLGSSA